MDSSGDASVERLNIFHPMQRDSAAITGAEQLELLLAALQLSDTALTLVDFSAGTFLDCNRAAHEQLGYGREEYLRLGPAGLQAQPDHDGRWVAAQMEQIQQQREGFFTTRHRCRDGRALDVEVHFQLVELRGQPLFLIVTRDITELLSARNQTERLTQLLREAEQLTQVGSWELIHATGDLLWSDGTYAIFEQDPIHYAPSYDTFLATIHPDDRAQVDQAYRQSLESHRPYQISHRLVLPSGVIKVVQERGTTTYGPDGRPARSIGTVQDITRLAGYEQQLERAAYVDGLTDLPNRQAALRYLQGELEARAGRREGGMAVVNLDLDGFGDFNNTFGLELGDRLLVAMSRYLREILPPTAFLARLEGDEFLVVQPCALSELEPISRHLQQALAMARLDDSQLPLLPSVSLGACHTPSHGEDPFHLLQAANTALMEAKRRGKNGCYLYSEDIRERIRRRVQLEAELQLALEREEFRLVFQPQVNRHGEVVGAEALLRWRNGQGEAIPPDVFIPLAEQSGHIHAIGSWVLRQACRHVQQWRAAGHRVPPLAINLSAVQFDQPEGELTAALVQTVREHGLESDAFELEITETALIRDQQKGRQECLGLNNAGFPLAIDDYGTGYASLVSLNSLPVHKLKVDTSFVRGMLSSSGDQAIVKSTIQLAHDLGLKALAEGVETEQQWQLLLELGCDLFQGYLFDRPLEPDAFEQRLAQTRSD